MSQIFIYLVISLLSLFIIIFLNKIYKNNSLLIEDLSKEDRKIHKFKVIRIGSVCFVPILLSTIYIIETTISFILYFSFLCLLLGLWEDISKSLDKYFRLIIIFIIVLIFQISTEILINDLDNQFLNILLNRNYVISASFVIFSLLLIINGFNFIDGVNGLLLGVSMIVLSIYSFYSFEVSHDIFILCVSSIASISVLFCFNIIHGKLLTGDGGSYFLGFLIGAISIVISNKGIINPLLIACILYYPIAEILLTCFRRLLFNNSSPFIPDNKHIHQILYEILDNKFDDTKSLISNNSRSSIILLFLISTSIFVSIMLSEKINILLIYFLLNIFYLFLYIFLYKLLEKF